MHITDKRTEFFLNLLQEKHDANYAAEYGEPSYSNPERGVLLANWNDVPASAQNYLEAAGYALEWCDEWTVVCNSSPSKAYRTNADSYHWRPTAVLPPEACEYLTPDDGANEAIEAFASEHPGQIYGVPYWVTDEDLTEAGWICAERELESGFFPGQTDQPGPIGDALLASGKARRVLGRVDGKGQFDCRFSVWYEPTNV